MAKEPILDFSIQKAIVDRLVAQYKEYLKISQACDVAERQYALAKISSQATDDNYKILRRIQDRLSDEMTFYTPRIWMQYKYEAYKDSPKEIATVGDFIDHCSPKGYICTKRFTFIKNWLKKYEDITFEGLQNDEDSINELINNTSIIGLESNSIFITEWLNNEFYISDSKISKWKTKIYKN
jgi:hypothetical protein